MSDPRAMDDELLERAVEVFHMEYRQNFPTWGDEGDDQDAIRAGIEAVIALVTAPKLCSVCKHPAEKHGPDGCEQDSFSMGRCFCSRTVVA